MQIKERIATLDLLRVLAAFSVLFFHYGFRGTIGDMSRVFYPEIYWPARYGFWGVELFFVISGFVIAASAEGRNAVQFAIARAGRIYPAFLVAMTITCLVIATMGMAPYSTSFRQWLTNLIIFAPIFDQPFMDGVYWTLGLEIIFYGWITMMIAARVYPRNVNWFTAVWLAICLVNAVLLESRPLKFIFLTEYGPYFISGILMHRLYAGYRDFATKVLFLLSVVIGFLHPIMFANIFTDLYFQSASVFVLCSLHIAIYVLMGLALWQRRRIVESRWLLALGGLTYPLYLIHENVGFILINHLSPIMGRWKALFVVIAIVTFVAYYIWRVVEPPIRKFLVMNLQKLFGKLPGHRVAAKPVVQR